MDEPPYGWTTTARVKRVVDGDTVDVEIKKTIRVRLLDIDTEELRSKDPIEKALAIIAKDKLSNLIEGKKVKLFIPTDDSNIFMELFTFGRVLGRLFYKGKDVNEYMKGSDPNG